MKITKIKHNAQPNATCMGWLIYLPHLLILRHHWLLKQRVVKFREISLMRG